MNTIKDYASACVLSTFGVDEQDYQDIIDAIDESSVEICYHQDNGEGRLSIAKKNVDSVAIQRALKTVLMIIGEKVYADEDATLAECAVKLLKKKGYLLSVAESLTGGMLSSLICDVEGASTVFYEGLVTYNSAAKVRRLHVSAGAIEEYSAVSEQVCTAMLDGVLASKDIHVAIATTGYASGAGENNGLVYIGVADKANKSVQEYRIDGDRNAVRRTVCNQALYTLIKRLETSIK